MTSISEIESCDMHHGNECPAQNKCHEAAVDSTCGDGEGSQGTAARVGDAGTHVKLRKRRKQKVGQGRRIERFLGYCRFCDIELERNTTHSRKCDGGGMGSILGNVVVMAGVLAMAASTIIKKSGVFDHSADLRQLKRVICDGSVLLLLVGWACERFLRDAQSSCCCKCAKSQQNISSFCRRTCYSCALRIMNEKEREKET